MAPFHGIREVCFVILSGSEGSKLGVFTGVGCIRNPDASLRSA